MIHDRANLLATILTEPARIGDLEASETLVLLAEVAAVQAQLAAHLAAHPITVGAAPTVQSRPQADASDRLLTPKETAAVLGVSVQWLYRRSKSLPFARKLSSKALRFSEAGLRRWQATRTAA